MKIDKLNVRHWLYLLAFLVNTVIAVVIRPFVKNRQSRHQVLLYGHKLNSNLKAIYEYWKNLESRTIDMAFLTMDPEYFKELKTLGVKTVLATRITTTLDIAKADCVISDHGLHALEAALRWSSIRFVDVWHGIPFKGFDADDFKVQRQFSEVWVTSSLLKKIYVEKFGFPTEAVFALGYARTDVLINGTTDRDVVKNSLGIADVRKKIILFAPTWRQDEFNRNIFPFGVGRTEFFCALDRLCQRVDAYCIFRTHLNSAVEEQPSCTHIFYAPHSQFPDTEAILSIADILVCDWSSIAFDFLLLNRPTVFLDVPPPFKKGFSLGASYRFGEIVGDFSGLLEALERYVQNPNAFQVVYGDLVAEIRRRLYDGNADGRAAERCYNRLLNLSKAS